jgi:hypothetical protein
MTSLIEQAINCNDGDLAAKIIRDALGIESDDVLTSKSSMCILSIIIPNA